jgi:hypothetical protein
LSKKRFILFALVAALVLSFTGMASAAVVKTWTGAAGDGNWSTGGNWSPAGEPSFAAGGDDVIIPSTAGTITVDAATSANPKRSLYIQDTGAGGVVTFELDAALNITAAAAIAVAPISPGTPGLYAGTDVVFADNNGTGAAAVVVFTDLATPLGIDFTVKEGKTVTFQVPARTTAAVGSGYRKLDKGRLAFNAPVAAVPPPALTIAAGTVSFPANSAALSVGAMTFNSQGVADANPTLEVTGPGSYVNAALFTFTTSGRISVTDTYGTLVYVNTGGVIAGAAGSQTITKLGAGTLAFGTPALQGSIAGAIENLVVAEGTVIDSNTVAAGTIAFPATINLTVNAGATFIANTVVPVPIEVVATLSGLGTVNIGTGNTFQINANSVVSGDITGPGALTIGNGVLLPTVTLVNPNNTYSGGTTITTNATLNFSSGGNFGIGAISFGAGGAPGGTLALLPGQRFVEVTNDVIVLGAAGNIGTVNVPQRSLLRITEPGHINYANGTLVKAGLGELEIARSGSSVNVGPGGFPAVRFVPGQGTVKISDSHALGLAPAQLNAGALLHVENGLTIYSDINVAAAALSGSAVGTTFREANKDIETPAFRTTKSFNGGGLNFNFAMQAESGTAIKAGDRFYVLQADRGINGVNVTTSLVPTSVFATDFSGNALPFTPHITEISQNQELFFTADVDFDVPAFAAPAGAAVTSGDKFTITIDVTSATDIDANSLAVYGLDPYVDGPATITGKTITITGTAPSTAVELAIPFRAYIASRGNTAGTVAGITVFEDFTLTVQPDGSGGGTDPTVDAPYYGWVWDGPVSPVATADATEFRATLSLNDVHTLPASTTPVALTSVDVKLSLGAAEVETKTFGEPADGKIVVTFTPADAATFAAGTYTLEVVGGVTPPAGYTQSDQSKTVTVTAPDVNRGSDGGGCDAGFGLFGLLAATGAVTLLRRKG